MSGWRRFHKAALKLTFSCVYVIGIAILCAAMAHAQATGVEGDCPATSAELNFPMAFFVDSSGNIFIADEGNSVVREVRAVSAEIL
jgi:hypothetical protein